MPFLELPHTADKCLLVWSTDLPSLFSEAARGMNYLAGIKLASQPVKQQVFKSTAHDSESLLVSFLSNLIYYMENERVGYDAFSIQLETNQITASMTGASLISVNMAIKAVTFHNLQIKKSALGFEVEIVFDV
mgnify:CR=1 FL=1